MRLNDLITKLLIISGSEGDLDVKFLDDTVLMDLECNDINIGSEKIFCYNCSSDKRILVIGIY